MCKLIRRCNLHIEPKRAEAQKWRHPPTETASESRPEWGTHEHWLRDRIQDLAHHVLEEGVLSS